MQPHSTNCPLSSNHRAILWLSCPHGGLFFSLSMIARTWPKASLLFLWKAFLIHHHPCEDTTILEPCLTCIKTRVIIALHKYNSSTGVGGNNFFFSAEGCYVWSVWANVREQKSLARGIQPAGGFPRSAEERREGSLDTAGRAEAIIQLN